MRDTVMLNREHLHDQVNDKTAKAMHDLALAIKEEIANYPASFPESQGLADIKEIYGVSYPGFIPSQQGGFEVTEFYMQSIDPSHCFNNVHYKWVQDSQNYCQKLFWDWLKSKHPRRRKDDTKLDDTFNWEQLSDKEQEELSEFENDWFESVMLRVSIYQKDLDRKSVV